MLTMKPERSFVTTVYLPIDSARAHAVAKASSPVSIARTTSTSDITGTGEKKCSPMTRSGRRVQDAVSAIGMDDVLLARNAAS